MKITKLNIWLYNLINNYVYRFYDLYFNRVVRRQIQNAEEIPIIIINFNQLFYLRQLIDFLQQRGLKKIVIIDNKSTYPPLLNYYNEIKENVKIEFMDENLGHAIFFKSKKLQKKYGQGFFVITDADVVPNELLPPNFMEQMIGHLRKYWKEITKVGFALKLDDIPEGNQLKDKILNWEKKFWQKQIDENIFEAPLDTTFSLYKPCYPNKYNNVYRGAAHRFGGSFTAKHGGWYLEQNNLTEEQKYYIETATTSSSWLQEDMNI